MISTIKYLTWIVKKVILGKNEPLISWVSLTRNQVHTFQNILEDINGSYNMGARVLYITDADHYRWPEDYTINDLINHAKKIGFSKVHVFTGGKTTFPKQADVIWIGIDELKKDFSARKGKSFFNTIKKIFKSSHKKILVDYTITKSNMKHLDDALRYFADIKKIKGIFINLEESPEDAFDESRYLTQEERNNIIDQIIESRKKYKIVNSVAGLEALKYNSEIDTILESGIVGSGNPDISSSGLLTELSETFKLKFSAILNSFNFI